MVSKMRPEKALEERSEMRSHARSLGSRSTGHPLLLSLAAALLAAGLAGCSTTAANTVEVGVGGKQVIVQPNGDLEDIVAFQSSKLKFIDEFAEVIVVLESLEDESVRIEYQVKWFDSDGIEMSDTKQTWDPIVIHAREQKTIKDMAPTPGAVKARVLVRLTDDQEY